MKIIEFMLGICIFRKQRDINLHQLMGNGIISFHSDYQVLYTYYYGKVFTGDRIGIGIKNISFTSVLWLVLFFEDLARNISFRSPQI